MAQPKVSPEQMQAWQQDLEDIIAEMKRMDAQGLSVTTEHLGLVAADLEYERYEMTGPDVKFTNL